MGLNQSQQADLEKVAYHEKVQKVNYNKDFKKNLLELGNMGFLNFPKNLMLLSQNNNDLEKVCGLLLEGN